MTREQLESLTDGELGARLLEGLGWESNWIPPDSWHDPVQEWWRPANPREKFCDLEHEVARSVDAILRHIGPAMLERGWTLTGRFSEASWFNPAIGELGKIVAWPTGCDGYDWAEAACRAALLALEGA